MKPGKHNLITDVDGITLGNAEDIGAQTGVTVILPGMRAVGAFDSRGGGPGTRETDALDPANLVDEIDAIVLSGGSVFGLEAASGVTAWLAERGRGFALVPGVPPSPIVPSAVLFDLNNGGDKNWGAMPPYRALGIQAVSRALADKFELGNSGAGLGAVAGIYKGGLGSASALTPEGYTIGAVVAVNSFGSTTIPGTARFWAAPFALGGELGDQSGARDLGDDGGLGKMFDNTKAHGEAMGHNTTIGVVATDAALTPVQAKRVAIMAHDGLARAIRPVHTPFDGDVIFVLSTGKKPLLDPAAKSLSLIGAVGADVTARAVARGVYEAQTLAGMSAYKDHHGQP